MANVSCPSHMLQYISISNNWQHLTLQSFGIILCILAVPLTYWCSFHFEKGKVQMSLRIIMHFHHINLLTYAISYTIIGSLHLITRIFRDGCDLLIPVNICTYIRIFQSIASIFFQVFYLAVVVDTFLAKFCAFWRNNENGARALAYLCIVFSIIEPLPSVWRDSSRSEYQLNCSSFEHKDSAIQRKIFLGFLFIDFISVAFFSILLVSQKIGIKDPVLRFSITKKHHEANLQRSLALILPNLALNMGCYVYFAGMSMWWTIDNHVDGNGFLWANSVPLYVCLSPVIWMSTLKRTEFKVSPAPAASEDYFKVLIGTWNDVFMKKHENGEKQGGMSTRLRFSITKKHHEANLQRSLALILPNLALNIGCYVYFAGMSMWWTIDNHVDGNGFLWANMPEECIMPSKSCVYVLVGTSNTAALYDFNGVYILDGGFAENTSGFLAHVSNASAVLISSPTLRNLGTTAALLELDKPLPVFFNVKPLKNVKPGSSGEVVKNIQEANSKWLPVTQPLFNLKYSPHIIYHSAAKGILSLYILAGDAKDAEVLTKALIGGNEAEVEKAAADHGTIGVLLWRPAQADKAVVRVLISGTSSLVRIQQSLDKAAKSLPFLNAPSIKSKDALSDIPPPVVPRPLVSVAGKLTARCATRGPSRTANFTAETPRPFTSRPHANGNPAIPKTAASRPFTSRPHANGNPAIPKTAMSRPFTSRPHVNGNPAISKAAVSRPFTSRPHANGNPAIQKTAAPTARRNAPSTTVPAISKPPTKVPAKSSVSTKKNPTRTPDKQQGTGRSTEPVSLKKTLRKVQGATPSKTTPVMIDTTPTLVQKPEPIAEKEPSIVETPLGVETPFDFNKEISKRLEIKIDTNSTMQISYGLDNTIGESPESEKLDAAASSQTQTLHMPAGAGAGVAAKPVKFSRPYYFDVVSVPRNEILETSVPAESLQEFIAKVRSRNVILASKKISSEQFQAILSGKQSWSDSVHPCNVIPTHSSPTLLDFLQKNEEHFPAAHLSLTIPVERQRTTVSSEAAVVEYELARIALE